MVRTNWDDSLTCFTETNDLLAVSGLDGIIMATDDPHHTQPTIAALHTGKNVTVEKPIPQSEADSQPMAVEGARAKGINSRSASNYAIASPLKECMNYWMKGSLATSP